MKLSDLLIKSIDNAPKGLWKFIAAIIVIFASGPGFSLTYELLALIDLLGADIFVLVYFTSFLALLEIPFSSIKRFVQNSWCVPSLEQIKKDKRSLLFLIYPIPTKAIEHFVLAGFVLCTIIGTIYIIPWELVYGG